MKQNNKPQPQMINKILTEMRKQQYIESVEQDGGFVEDFSKTTQAILDLLLSQPELQDLVVPPSSHYAYYRTWSTITPRIKAINEEKKLIRQAIKRVMGMEARDNDQ